MSDLVGCCPHFVDEIPAIRVFAGNNVNNPSGSCPEEGPITIYGHDNHPMLPSKGWTNNLKHWGFDYFLTTRFSSADMGCTSPSSFGGHRACIYANPHGTDPNPEGYNIKNVQRRFV